MRIVTECVIAGSHHLPNYEGKCKNVHGHNWRVKVCLDGWPLKIGPYQGMLMDFSFIKEVVNSLDHRNLNDVVENPTAENIAIWLCEEIKRIAAPNIENVIIQVYEMDKSYAQVSSEELEEKMMEQITEPPEIKVPNEPDKDIGTQVVEGSVEDDSESEDEAEGQ